MFALEEESDWGRFSTHRLARYCLDLAEMFDTDRVVPVTIFLRDAERAPASLVLGTERHRYLVFDYVACKLAAMPAENWLDSGNLVARVNLPNMDSGALDRVDSYASAVRGKRKFDAFMDRMVENTPPAEKMVGVNRPRRVDASLARAVSGAECKPPQDRSLSLAALVG